MSSSVDSSVDSSSIIADSDNSLLLSVTHHPIHVHRVLVRRALLNLH